MNKRTVFFVSDQTGVTAETLGNSLLTQFDTLDFRRVTLPFISSVDKAKEVARKINLTAQAEGASPVVFCTFVNDEFRQALERCDGLVLDFFDTFIGPIEKALGTQSSHMSGKAHGDTGSDSYARRMDAMNYALANDDGANPRDYGRADVVLVGVSRSGKTPSCLYLALNYGIYAANYPLTEDEFEQTALPPNLAAVKEKLFGLTIEPRRLQQIRQQRRPDSRYASARQVSFELRGAESMFRRFGIRFLDTTNASVEEIAARVLHEAGLRRGQDE